MGAVIDRLSLDLDELKSYLGITGSSYDTLLTDLFAASKEAADEYLNNDFLDDDGSELDIPRQVKYGCYLWVGGESRIPGLAHIAGVQSVKTGDIQVVYGTQAETGYFAGGSYIRGLTPEVERLWQHYREQPGF